MIEATKLILSDQNRRNINAGLYSTKLEIPEMPEQDVTPLDIV